jgi:hypothetical protein
MPELPGIRTPDVLSNIVTETPTEVERAAKLLRTVATGKSITRVQTVEDLLVYSGTSHDEFVSNRVWVRCSFLIIYMGSKASTIKGRTVETAGRYGTYSVMQLNLADL